MGCAHSVPSPNAPHSVSSPSSAPLHPAPGPLPPPSASTGFVKNVHRSLAPKAVSDSVVSFYEIVHQEHCSSLGLCRASVLLRWLDICACLSAERHAGLSSVTLSLDELTFDQPIEGGTTVEIRANVNNAFNTSVEVGAVVRSTGKDGKEVVHCRAHFTFVSLDHNGVKDKVPSIIPETEYERDCFVMAKERRALRFKRKDMIKNVAGRIKTGDLREQRTSLTMPADEGQVPSSSSHSNLPPKHPSTAAAKKSLKLTAFFAFSSSSSSSPPPPPLPLPPSSSTPPAASLTWSQPIRASAIQMTKLVLPSDANHMNNVFGGVIMSWMDDACTIAASRHVSLISSSISSPVALDTIAIDAMTFLGPAKVGDRITLKAQVNRAFGTTLEVGVRVEGETLGGETRHINTGYFTIMGRWPAEQEGGIKRTGTFKMPEVLPESKEDFTHFEEALARRHLRMERRTLASLPRAKGENLAWKWNDSIAAEMCVANVYGLLKVANLDSVNWRPRDLEGCALWGDGYNKYNIKMEVSDNTTASMGITTVRITGLAPAAPIRMFETVMDSKRRSLWDVLVEKCEVASSIDENSDVEWRSYKDVEVAAGSVEKSAVKKDFCLLRTWRLDNDRYIIASRSIVHPVCPVSEEYERGSVNPSGFILTPFDYDDGMERGEPKKMTSFTYVIQMDKVSAKMINTEGGGFVRVLAGSLFRLCAQLE